MPQVTDKKIIDKWKEEHDVKNIEELKVERVSEDGKNKEYFFAYAKRPTIQVLGLVKKFEESDPAKSWEILYDNTKIVADPEIEADEELKMAVIIQMTKIFTHHEVEVKKL